MKIASLILAGMVLISSNASAAIVTFFGQDLVPGGVVPAGGLAETARNDFLSNLVGVGTEDFESLSTSDSSPFSIDFAGSAGNITATLAGTGLDLRDFPSVGTYATSGGKFLRASTGTSATAFTITFSKAVAAFGFFGTDLGDAGGGELVLTLGNTGVSEQITVDVDGPSGTPSGNLAFFGFISDTDEFTSISFANTGGSGDVWGFDDMTVGDLGQVQPKPTNPASAPGALALLIAGLAGVTARRKMRR